jgi:hypothetical protein
MTHHSPEQEGTTMNTITTAQAAQAVKDALEAAHRAEAEAQGAVEAAAPRPQVRRAGGTRLSDLAVRLVARQDRQRAERDLSPVRRTIREQVRAITEAFTGGTPVAERNRQGFVEAMASKRNHLGQVNHVYAGTVSPKTIQHRRARGKMAKASRKVNRHG